MAKFFLTKYIFVVVFVLSITNNINAQSSNSAYKKLKREAEAYFIDEIFKNALPLFLQLEQMNPNDPELNYKTGVCYLHSPFKSKAIPYFERAKVKDKVNQYSDIDYYLGVAYHYDHQFDRAIDYYHKYTIAIDTLSEYGNLILPTIKKYIQNCEVGKLLVANPTKAKIEHLNTNVNSVYSETYPVITHDGNTLYFSSQRHESTGGKIDDDTDEFYEDIYFSKKTNNHWGLSKHIGQINSFKHDAPLCLSADGKRIYFYTTNELSSSDIFYSDYNGTEWSAPQSMGPNINSTSGEFDASISADGKTFYFSSNRPGGFGGMDIYYSKFGEDGKWGPSVNLGSRINTSFDEESPNLLPDGKTMFFSSEGPNSIGGLDVFKTIYNSADSSWSQPLNMGYPINTAEHEFEFAWSPDGKSAYFSSFRKDTYGEEDIYYAEITDEEPVVKVYAKTEESKSVPVAKTYARPGTGQILKQKAFFDFNIYSQPSDFSIAQLQEVIDLLNEYPDIKLEVGGHTDSIGSYKINKLISDKRANAIYRYLTAHGVSDKRLKRKGYAFYNLVVNGKSTLENGPNRRVEFKVISDQELAAPEETIVMNKTGADKPTKKNLKTEAKKPSSAEAKKSTAQKNEAKPIKPLTSASNDKTSGTTSSAASKKNVSGQSITKKESVKTTTSKKASEGY